MCIGPVSQIFIKIFSFSESPYHNLKVIMVKTFAMAPVTKYHIRMA